MSRFPLPTSVPLTEDQLSCIEICGCDLDLIGSGDVRCLCVIEVDERDVQHAVCGNSACACTDAVPA